MEPGLNPYQPNQRMNMPMVAREMLWPGMARTSPLGPYLPRRAPTAMAPMSPAMPPTVWTMPEPAKST